MIYFQHDVDARDAQALILLESRFGATGYMFYFKALEMLAADDQFGGPDWPLRYYQWDYLVRSFNLTRTKIQAIFEYSQTFSTQNFIFRVEFLEKCVGFASVSEIKGSKNYKKMIKTPLKETSRNSSMPHNKELEVEGDVKGEGEGKESAAVAATPPPLGVVMAQTIDLMKTKHRNITGAPLVFGKWDKEDLGILVADILDFEIVKATVDLFYKKDGPFTVRRYIDNIQPLLQEVSAPAVENPNKGKILLPVTELSETQKAAATAAIASLDKHMEELSALKTIQGERKQH